MYFSCSRNQSVQISSATFLMQSLLNTVNCLAIFVSMLIQFVYSLGTIFVVLTYPYIKLRTLHVHFEVSLLVTPLMSGVTWGGSPTMRPHRVHVMVTSHPCNSKHMVGLLVSNLSSWRLSTVLTPVKLLHFSFFDVQLMMQFGLHLHLHKKLWSLDSVVGSIFLFGENTEDLLVK